LKQDAFRKLISGRKKGLTASFLRCLLGFASIFYLLAVKLRNFLYNKGLLKIHRVNAPVISIGNITTGGTGKTPLVIWLANMLSRMDLKCFVLTRGYKQGKGDKVQGTSTDEPAIISQSCPQGEVIVNPDRFAAASKVLSENKSAIENRFSKVAFVMDDGFQHRQLSRDLDILTIDATCPFGFGKLLPAGLLREPLNAVKRADAIVLTRTDLVSKSELAQIEEKIKALAANPDILIAKSNHFPVCAKTSDETEIGLDEIGNKKVFAFCGIGNPESFFDTIKICGCKLVGTKIYDDHHKYSKGDIAEIYDYAAQLNADLILTTQKDFTKCSFDLQKQKIKLAFLLIELRFIVGQDKLRNLINNTLTGKISQIQNGQNKGF